MGQLSTGGSSTRPASISFKLPYWTELELASDNSDGEFDYYLDTETGQNLLVTDEARRQLETLLEQVAEAGSGADFDLFPVLAQTELQEW